MKELTIEEAEVLLKEIYKPKNIKNIDSLYPKKMAEHAMFKMNINSIELIVKVNLETLNHDFIYSRTEKESRGNLIAYLNKGK